MNYESRVNSNRCTYFLFEFSIMQYTPFPMNTCTNFLRFNRIYENVTSYTYIVQSTSGYSWWFSMSLYMSYERWESITKNTNAFIDVLSSLSVVLHLRRMCSLSKDVSFWKYSFTLRVNCDTHCTTLNTYNYALFRHCIYTLTSRYCTSRVVLKHNFSFRILIFICGHYYKIILPQIRLNKSPLHFKIRSNNIRNTSK